MKFAKVKWSFLRIERTNIVLVIGEGECEETGRFLLSDTIQIFRIAKQFNAIPIQTQDVFKIKAFCPWVIRTALLFRTEKNLIDFFRYVKTHRI